MCGFDPLLALFSKSGDFDFPFLFIRRINVWVFPQYEKIDTQQGQLYLPKYFGISSILAAISDEFAQISFKPINKTEQLSH